jgi:hypothetical protein
MYFLIILEMIFQALELYRTIRGNAIRRIKNALFHKFDQLKKINNDATIQEISQWKSLPSTKYVLDNLREIEEEDGCSHLETITKIVFSGDRGKIQGTNLGFVWAIINAFIGTENDSLHIEEKIIVPLMNRFQVK